MPDFKTAVLAWLKEDQNIVATEVTQVSGYGTDWEGDTEGGFYDSFSVTIRYLDANHVEQFKDVNGEDMGSLWTWVVRRWPDA